MWKDFSKIWNEMDVISKQEYRSIFTDRRVGGDALGSVRTLEEYEQFAGLDFRTGQIHQSKWAE